MSRSTLIPVLIVSLGLAFVAVANTGQDAASPAADSHQGKMPTVAEFQAIVKRVEKLERKLSAPQLQEELEELGRGFFAIEPVVINLNEEKLNRYIRAGIVLSVRDGQEEPAFTALTRINPEIKDWVYGLLAGKTLEDVRGQENQQKLRVEIKDGINSQLKSAGHPEFVKAVLFDDINVQ